MRSVDWEFGQWLDDAYRSRRRREMAIVVLFAVVGFILSFAIAMKLTGRI
jgi:hypothetical protein